MLEGDLPAMEALRSPDYVHQMPNGETLSRTEELTGFADGGFALERFDLHDLEILGGPTEVEVQVRGHLAGRLNGTRVDLWMRFFHSLERDGDGFVLTRSRSELEGEPPDHAPRALIARARARIGHRLRRREESGFSELAYRPYKRGEDFLVPPRSEHPPGDELPVPPAELWQGYRGFVEGGAVDSERMLEIVRRDGFDFARGDRILDLGCGAGRMIRHLGPLAASCEIWGADILAEHIMWCRQNLSPPFHFVTTTKVPHLPFADRSFRLVYCGSLFTHIDDLPETWLLELGRLLVPGGRLYVTIHDEETLATWNQPTSRRNPIPRMVLDSKVGQEALASGFDMFTVGRGHNAQVFHAREHFLRLAGPAFTLVEAVPHAYSAQTALLLERVP